MRPRYHLTVTPPTRPRDQIGGRGGLRERSARLLVLASLLMKTRDLPAGVRVLGVRGPASLEVLQGLLVPTVEKRHNAERSEDRCVAGKELLCPAQRDRRRLEIPGPLHRVVPDRHMRERLRLVERERPGGSRERRVEREACPRMVREANRVGTRDQGFGTGEGRVDPKGFACKAVCPVQRVPRVTDPGEFRPGSQVELERLEALRGAGVEARERLEADHGLERVRHALCDVALDLEDVTGGQRPVVSLRPHLLGGGPVQQPNVDPDALRRPLNPRRQHRPDAEVPCDLPRRERAPLVRSDRGRRDDAQVGNPGDLRDQVVMQAARERIVLGQGAQVFERKDRDRGAVELGGLPSGLLARAPRHATHEDAPQGEHRREQE